MLRGSPPGLRMTASRSTNSPVATVQSRHLDNIDMEHGPLRLNVDVSVYKTISKKLNVYIITECLSPKLKTAQVQLCGFEAVR